MKAFLKLFRKPGHFITFLFLIIVFSSNFSIAQTQTLTPSFTFDTQTGTLTFNSVAGGRNAFIITVCAYGMVQLNGDWIYPGGNYLPATNVRRLYAYGGSYGDTCNFSAVTGSAFPNLQGGQRIYAFLGRGNTGFVGSSLPNVVTADSGCSNILGGDGNDRITLQNNTGNVWGLGGQDTMRADYGFPRLYGGSGNNMFQLNHGCIDTGPGNNTINIDPYDSNRVSSWPSPSTVSFGSGTNRAILTFSNPGSMYTQGTYQFVMPGSSVQTVVQMRHTGSVALYKTTSDVDIIIDDNGGIETLDFSEFSSGILIDLDMDGTIQTIDPSGIKLTINGTVENITGSEYDDEIFIDPLADRERTVNLGGEVSGDILNFDGHGFNVSDDGTKLTSVGFLPVNYEGAESILITNAPNYNPTITITSPNGGESWDDGTVQQITWTTIGIVGSVKIECTDDDGTSWTIITSSTENDGIYDWTIPDSPSQSCKIKISEASDGDPSDMSDNVFSINSSTGIDNNDDLPIEFSLYQNYPNPFNPSTTISYSLASESKVNLTVYDILGNLVEEIINENKPAGMYRVNWNSKNQSSGIYFYKLVAGLFVEVKRMVLLK